MKKYEVIKDFNWCDIDYKIKDKIKLDNYTSDFLAKNGFIKNPRITEQDIILHQLINELARIYNYSSMDADRYEYLVNKCYDQDIKIDIIKEKLHELSTKNLIELEKSLHELQQELQSKNRKQTESE